MASHGQIKQILKSKAYIYPLSKRNKSNIYNPYIDNFITSFERYEVCFLNKDNPSVYGIFDLIKYIKPVNIVFVNWIENLSDKKLGYFQCVFFMFVLVPLLKIGKKRIVWTLHNLGSHESNHRIMRLFMFKYMLKSSDVIITHATEGLKYVRGISNKKNVIYFPHPFYSVPKRQNDEKDIDILIWGTMARYKAIHDFVKLVNVSPKLMHSNILIIGKFPDNFYYQEVVKLNNSKNLTIKNSFIPGEKLNQLMHRSKVILFTYNHSSVLSSGALVGSLGFNNIIIGPNKGAFHDLFKNGLIMVFDQISEIPKLLEKAKNQDLINFYFSNQIKFIKKHLWANIPEMYGNQIFNNIAKDS